MRASEAIRHIHHVASMGLAPRVAIPVMMGALSHVVPSQSNPFFWSAPDGTITDFHIDEIRPHTMETSMMRGRHNTPDDEPTFDRLIAGPRLVDNTALLRGMAGWSHSAFYNDMLRGNEAENSVDFQLRDATGVRGMFALTRGAKDRPLKAAELKRAASLVPHFLHAMNAPTEVDDRGARCGERSYHIIVDPDDVIESFSDGSPSVLLQLHNMPLSTGVSLSDFATRLPPSAKIVLERLRLVQSGEGELPASIEVPTRWGLFRVAATSMRSAANTESGRVIVTIQPLVETRMRRAQKLFKTDLTLAERRVALEMASADDADTIARTLGLQISSYRQYAKPIYATLGVSGRIGVKAMLDG